MACSITRLGLYASLVKPAWHVYASVRSRFLRTRLFTTCSEASALPGSIAIALVAYQGTRIYRLEYRGFLGSRSAEMVVDVEYKSPETKEFIILSETGSKLLIERVFKKAFAERKRGARRGESKMHRSQP
jgi:hypothetical protein